MTLYSVINNKKTWPANNAEENHDNLGYHSAALQL